MNIYKHFALIGFVTYWSVALFMIRKWWGGRGTTFSQHAASNKTAQRLFAAAVSAETILYLLYVYGWFVPYYNMSLTFTVLVTITAVGHFIVGIIPETTGLKKLIHRKVSYWSVVLFIPELIIISFTQTINVYVRTVAIAFAFVLMWAWYQFLFKLNRREDIVNQALYIATLPIVLILAAYIR